MFQGNWKCSKCGGAITQLPFQPRSEAGLDIPDFAEVAGEPAPFEDYGEATLPPVVAEKPRFEGKWKCATCDGDITSLPFAPRDVTNLKCLDCFKKSKQ
jgi:ribosomal protein L37AE/L43A